jgi:putative flavoprotein involved in K+ transport
MKKAIETVIIGGGQAGLAISYYLKEHGHEHIVLEQAAQSADAWRNGRWDSFTLVTPNWTVQMPGAAYQGEEPHGFMTRNEVVAYLEDYINRFELPVKFQARVHEVTAQPNGGGYLVITEDEVLEASNVVVATGLFQQPKLPSFSSSLSSHIDQLHSSQYRNPDELSPGAVLVVGSGQSGAQIAEELYKSGRSVYLSVGSAGRGPRRYRGKDITEWFGMMSELDEKTVDDLPSSRAKFAGSPHVSGTNGGHSLNLHQFARDGVNLLGRIQGASGDKISLEADLRENLANTDKFELELTKMIDGYIETAGLDAPEQNLEQLQDGFEVEVVRELDLNETGITSIIWATGYAFDFHFVKLPIFDEDGYPIQKRGVTEYHGMYFLGLPWLYTQGSGLLSGVGDDAAYLASDITSNGSA